MTDRKIRVSFGIVLFPLLMSLNLHSRANESEGLIAHLRDGSIVKINTPVEPLKWTTLRNGKVISETQYDWSNIAELTFYNSPVGDQMTQVQNLMANLKNSDYQLREAAEKQLSDPDYSSKFLKLLQRTLKSETDAEARFRIRRILQNVARENRLAVDQNDELVFVNRKVVSGEADWSTELVLLDQSFELNRSNVVRIEKQVKPSAQDQALLKCQTFNLPTSDFYNAKTDQIFNFESDLFGNEIPVGRDVNEYFSGQGLLMKTEMPGYVKLINYPFKFSPIDAGRHCVCPFDAGTKKRLRGTTRIRFCLPGQPSTVAYVRKFGVFLERIEHSRDMVVEAYNDLEQIIGQVESTDQICVFAGFISNEGISEIRITANENLPKLNRPIDQTYAFDLVTFDQPNLNPTRFRLSDSNYANLQLTSGDFLKVNLLSYDLQQVEFESDSLGIPSRKVPWKQIESISLVRPKTSFSAAQSDTFAQLKNGSIIKVDAMMEVFDFIGASLKQQNIVGFWSGKARMAPADDFAAELPVLVFPSCRIVADEFRWNGEGIQWDQKNSQKKVTQVALKEPDGLFDQAEVPDPDLTPQVSTFSSKNIESWPTIWLRQPAVSDLGQPHVRFLDGQFFALKDGFTIESIDKQKKTIELSFQGISKIYPLARVTSLSLPKSGPTD